MKTLTNWREALEAAILNPTVGIAHSVLSGTANFRLHVTALKPNSKVAAHVHFEDQELYIIQTGNGLLYTGQFNATEQIVIWNTPLPVKEGDTFTISEGEVHQLHNTGLDELILIFGCPDSHLSDDRLVVADY